MTKILFQGDSITDGGRKVGLDYNHTMGQGYPFIISSRLSFECPQKDYIFENRGVSGDSSGNLCGRWQGDTLDLEPDIISILIGTNDAGREANTDKRLAYHGLAPQLIHLINQTNEVLPNAKFILMEPFVLDTGNLEKAQFERRYEILSDYQRSIKAIAKEHDCIFVPLQQRFNDALKLKPASYWLWDSIHPNYAGHGLIAQAWIDDTKALLK